LRLLLPLLQLQLVGQRSWQARLVVWGSMLLLPP
jgi:hypothetical protein